MNILSLFDGMACGMLAMMKAGIQVDNYYAYEIDKYAIQTATHNFPQIQELGDVFNADFRKYNGIDYLIGGSPCTYWSIAQSPDKRETTASGMGWELFSQYIRALHEAKPKYFIYENNKSMAKAIYNSISETFGFEPIMINSALVSSQNRQRLYWVGKRNADGTYSKADVQQPEDRGILLKDILDGACAWNTIERHQRSMAAEPVCVASRGRYSDTDSRSSKTDAPTYQHYEARTDGKTNAVTTVSKDNLIGEPVCMRYERSERAKQLRKDYESGAIKHGYHEYHELQPRTDGKSNTLSTVQKDNPICVPVRCFTLPREDGVQTQSKQYRVYNIDGKTTTLCAEGCGMGAKTGLYAVPINKYMSKRICTMTNKQGDRIYSIDAKSICLTSSGGNFGGFSGAYAVPVEFDGDIPIKVISAADSKTYTVYEVEGGNITIKGKTYPIKLVDGYYIIRKLTVSECKRLQTVPEWYQFPVSDTRAYKMLGNGWTVDVIAHLIEATKTGKTVEKIEQLTLF